MKRNYGLIPRVVDRINDYQYSMLAYVPIPSRVDLSAGPWLPLPAYKQDIGECLPSTLSKIVDFILKKQKKEWMNPSRRGLYYMMREEMGTVDYDSGCDMRTGGKVLIKRGVFPESMWDHDKNFTEKPSYECYEKALEEQMLQYEFIDNDKISLIKNVLASGFPIACGIPVYESFESDEVTRTGRVPMPDYDEDLYGGHAITLIGYNDNVRNGIVMFMNSWGADWGKNGVGSLPYKYIENLAFDLMVVRRME